MALSLSVYDLIQNTRHRFPVYTSASTLKWSMSPSSSNQPSFLSGKRGSAMVRTHSKPWSDAHTGCAASCDPCHIWGLDTGVVIEEGHSRVKISSGFLRDPPKGRGVVSGGQFRTRVSFAPSTFLPCSPPASSLSLVSSGVVNKSCRHGTATKCRYF